ncbi:MAG: DUF4855 domain-containing protein [Planctomycetota bacterium]
MRLDRILCFLTVVLLLAMSCRGLAADGYFPPGDPKAGGIRDLMLIYLSKDRWTKDEFLPYVAYLDKDRKPKDWFYDSFLFLQYGGAPSGTDYIAGPSLKSDWLAYFDLLFQKDRNLHALAQCVRDLEGPLGPYPRRVPLILMIPYPSPRQTNFGDVDGDGRSENLSVHEDRCKAARWCVDELLRRWNEAGFAAFRLWGFYWMNEGIGPEDESIVRATAEHIHKVGYGLHWIPWFSAPGVDRVEQLGIDFAIMQPNYAFMARHTRPDEQRLADTAYLAKKYLMGIEIEMPGQISEQAERDNLLDYLSHGRDCMDGYMCDAVHGYYQGTDAIAKLCYSDVPADRALYDALYQFAKGKFDGARRTISTECRYRIRGNVSWQYPDDGRKLTDGLWAGDENYAERAVGLNDEAAEIVIDLDAIRRIGGVDVHVVADKDGQTAFPSWIDVATSTDGENWQPGGRIYRHPTSQTENRVRGFMVHEFPPRDALQVKIILHRKKSEKSLLDIIAGAPSQKTMLIDEIAVRPVASPAYGARYTLSPPPSPHTPNRTGCVLTDGVYAKPKPAEPAFLRWDTTGEIEIILDLPDEQHIGLIRAHVPQVFNWLAVPRPIELRAYTRLNPSAAWREAGSWKRPKDETCQCLDIEAGGVLAKAIRLVAAPDRGAAPSSVLFDEIEVYPAVSLARGKPYALDPAHPAKYGDASGRELTDGMVCEKGFGDGRTVGWSMVEPTAIFDLGREQKIDAIRAHVEGGGHAAIEFPKRIDILVSPDGQLWTWINSIQDAPSTFLLDSLAGQARSQLGWMGGKIDLVEARFVMLRFAPGGYWTMISEIEIVSNGKNIAPEGAYRLHPLPTSAENYADTTGKLTDGIYTTSDFGQGRAVGWNKGRPSITVDLCAPTEIAAVSAHVLGGGRAGVWFPKKMSVSVSPDGRTWQEFGATSDHPSEAGDEAARGFMTASAASTKCRFVKLVFDPHGWCMVDEIEIFGSIKSKGK